MPGPLEQHLADALEQVQRKQAELVELRGRIAALRAEHTTKDRLLTVSCGPQGRPLKLTFHDDGYRSMPPAQLAAVLEQAIDAARTAADAQLGALVAPLTAEVRDLRETMRADGRFDALTGPADAPLGARLGTPRAAHAATPTDADPYRDAPTEEDADRG